jgi:hypothetical protein
MGRNYTLPLMQKLFSMFPRGAPGLALLMLRLFLGPALITDAATAVSALNEIAFCLVVACAAALIVGIGTPIAAILAVLIEAAIVLNTHLGHLALDSFSPIVIGASLALLGPGAYSLDARIFGRRLLKFGPDITGDKN